MSESRWQDELGPLVLPLQIIVAALVAGTVFFTVIVLAVPIDVADAAAGPLLSYIAIAFAVTALLARTIVPGILISRGRKKVAEGEWPITPKQTARQCVSRMQNAGDAGKLWLLYSTITIVAGALIEGATFFLLVAYMLERWLPGLVVAMAMILTLAAHLPTRRRAFQWIEDQLALLQQERGLGY